MTDALKLIGPAVVATLVAIIVLAAIIVAFPWSIIALLVVALLKA